MINIASNKQVLQETMWYNTLESVVLPTDEALPQDSRGPFY